MTSPLQQKVKVAGTVVVTANRLGDGAVVYRTSDGHWTTHLEQAAVVDTAPEATALLTTARADVVEAVDVYVAPVEVDAAGGVQPGNLRETIRQRGPSFELPANPGH
jgi:hypothetical protein